MSQLILKILQCINTAGKIHQVNTRRVKREKN